MGDPHKIIMLEQVDCGTFIQDLIALCILHFKVVKTIRQERLLDLVNKSGKTILDGLAELESRFPEVLSRSRGLGTLCAVDVKSADIRDKILHGLKQQGINLGGCGDSTIRISAAHRAIGSTTGCTITEKAPTRAFS